MDESDILIDIIIILMYVLLASTLAVSVWSAWNGVRTHQRRQSTRIGYGVAAFTVVLLVVTWLLGSTRPIVSNGQVFDNPWWLRLTDMFLLSSLILIIVCSVIVVIAKFRR